MVDDSASVSSFNSLDNVSRSSMMLRKQRETALRRRQNQVPTRTGSDGSRSTANQMGSMATTAMADVLAWEEAKTKERIEARIKEEENQRADEARMKVQRAKAAEAERKASAARKVERERFEQEQSELRRKLAEERKAKEEATQQLQEEARRLAEAKADADRLEKEKIVAEVAKRLELERLEMELQRERLERESLAVAERAKVEAERLAEQARMLEQQRLRASAGFQKSRQAGLPVSEQQPEPLTLGNEISFDTASGYNGYQQYLTSFHQPAEEVNGLIGAEPREDVTIISALTEAENNTFHPASRNTDVRGSKIKRSTSTRSLSFTEAYEEDRSNTKKDAEEETKSSSSAQSSGTSKEDRSEKSTTSKDDTLEPTPKKVSSFQQLTSIENVNLDDPKAMRSFLVKPCLKGGGMIQCCIRRNKGLKNALFPEYRMYLKTNNSKTETFLMTSKKRAGSKTSNYLISMSRNDHDKNSDSILGKLRSNFLGTEYTIYDHGKNPDFDEAYYDEKNDTNTRCELGVILYAVNSQLAAKGPRKMKACFSKVDDDGNPLKKWQPSDRDDERMGTCFKKNKPDVDKLDCMENKPPSWNEEVGAYVLNFNGRVTKASVKNFQLVRQDDEKEQIMQFGRTEKEEFSLDVQWPMSLHQAFAVALSSFDSKLGCD